MATRASYKSVSFKAAADLSAKQYLFMKITADQTVNVCGVLGEKAIGVLLNKPNAAGLAAEVALLDGGGKLPITLNATLSAGARIETDTNGKAIAATTSITCLGELAEGGIAGDVVAFIPYIIPL
jgi:hypothetical protein